MEIPNILDLATIFLTNKHDKDVTKSLESAVRKMSRGNSPLYGNSPTPNSSNNGIEPLCISGLSGLAKGYEQYRESLISLRLTTEYGEASSDDLSSEWENSKDDISDQSTNNTVTLKESLATNLAMNVARRRKMIPNCKSDAVGQWGKILSKLTYHFYEPTDIYISLTFLPPDGAKVSYYI